VSAPVNEFSRPLRLEGRQGRLDFAIAAEPAELGALAARFSLEAIERLEASGSVRARPGGGWRLALQLRAEVVQTCVVSLEPVVTAITEPVQIDFLPANRPGHAIEIDLDAEDDAEPLPEDGVLDVGEIAAQHLSLALPPFPRASHAAWDDRVEAAAPAPGPEETRLGAALSRARRASKDAGEA
jgi:uncharacterized metal-binding protein YceD (DUF177 family)